jgi:DNA-binding IclR family transcriptional regulator
MPGREVDESTVLGKAVAVLHAFGADDAHLSLAELGRRTGLAKATLHRIAGDLVAVRLLDRTGTSYRLSSGLFQLGMRASAERSLVEVATPFLEDIYERTHELAHLGIRDGHEVVYLLKIGGHRQARSPSRLGGRMPLHCTAIGKVLLAHGDDALLRAVLAAGLERRASRTITNPRVLRTQLRAVIENGVAFEYEESTVGIGCVAAPIAGADGQVIAALSVTGPTDRFTPAEHRGAVRAAATGISRTLQLRASSS